MSPNPLQTRLTQYMDPDLLRAGLASPGAPVGNLSALPVHTAKRRLQEQLQTVYAPTTQAIALARRILSTGLAHALRAYPDVATYVRTATQDRLDVENEPETWVITGLAGDGKTALVNALKTLLGEGDPFQASEHCPRRPIRGGIFLTVHPKTSRPEIFAAVAQRLGLEMNCDRPQPTHLIKIQLELYRQGCCFIVADEAQSNDSGKRVGAAYVNLINHLRRFGLPVIVVGNYSMCHGLLQQHSQNRQRLLNDPFVLTTSAPEDPDYIAHLAQYKIVCGELLAVDPKNDAVRIHWLTGGGRRALLHLLGIAYALQRERSRAGNVHVDVEALERAYQHESFFAHRREVEALRSHWLTGRSISQDLTCPFAAVGVGAQARRENAQRTRLEAIAAATLVGSMSPTERKGAVAGQLPAPDFVPARSELGRPIEASEPLRSGSVGGMVLKDALAPRKRTPRKPPPDSADLQRSWGT